MAMVPYGYGPPQQQPSQPTVRSRLKHHLILLALLFTATLLLGLLKDPRRGLLIIGLAWALLGLLSNHRALGRRKLVKALIEYAAVAALVLAVAAPGAPQVKRPTKPTVKVEATQAEQVQGLREAVANLWGQAATGFSQFGEQAPPAKKERR